MNLQVVAKPAMSKDEAMALDDLIWSSSLRGFLGRNKVGLGFRV